MSLTAGTTVRQGLVRGGKGVTLRRLHLRLDRKQMLACVMLLCWQHQYCSSGYFASRPLASIHVSASHCCAGNKADLEGSRAVTAEEATAYANENGLFFMETSAKTAANVNELFTEIARKLPKAEAPRQQQPGIVLDTQPQPQAARKVSSCC